MTTDTIQFTGLVAGFLAIAIGAYLAWGIGYSLLVSGVLLLSAVMRARAVRVQGATEQ